MPTCVQCGSAMGDEHEVSLCTWHSKGEDEGWAANNKVMCDFIHRGVPLPSLADVREEGERLAAQVRWEATQPPPEPVVTPPEQATFDYYEEV